MLYVILVVDCLKDRFELLKAPRVHEVYIYTSDSFVFFRYILRLEALNPPRRGFEPPFKLVDSSRSLLVTLDPFDLASSHLPSPRLDAR